MTTTYPFNVHPLVAGAGALRLEAPAPALSRDELAVRAECRALAALVASKPSVMGRVPATDFVLIVAATCAALADAGLLAEAT